MAWIDDRIWCHPKLVGLSSPSFRAYINGLAYSAGMGTKGLLTPAMQRQISGNPRTRDELAAAGLWDIAEDGKSVTIHDWDEHNGKRDKRREQDRLRKRAARLSAGTSTGQSAGQDAGASALQSSGASAGQARVEGSEGSERENPRAVTYQVDASGNGHPTEQPLDSDIDFTNLLRPIP